MRLHLLLGGAATGPAPHAEVPGQAQQEVSVKRETRAEGQGRMDRAWRVVEKIEAIGIAIDPDTLDRRDIARVIAQALAAERRRSAPSGQRRKS